MMTEEYDDQEGRRVWLSREEVDALLEVVDDPLRKVAFRLAAECGLRTHEIVEVTPDHVVDGGEAGQMLVVPEGKGEKYREAPIPDSLAGLVDAAASFGGVAGDDALVGARGRCGTGSKGLERSWSRVLARAAGSFSRSTISAGRGPGNLRTPMSTKRSHYGGEDGTTWRRS